jgi:fluoride exporter
MMLINVLHAFLEGISRSLALIPNHAALRAPLAVSLGAIPGALARYYLGQWLSHWLGTRFPLGTFLINLTGVMIMGFFVTLTLERSIASPDLRLLVAVGFLGSYTTFSTYALELSMLMQTDHKQLALFYGLGSTVFGVLSLELGSFLARKIS